MAKRFNMLALIVLLVFQTMLAPVAVTAQGLPSQEDAHAATAEDQDNDDAAESDENENSENGETTDADEEAAEEEATSEDDDGTNEGETNDDASGENTETDGEVGGDSDDPEGEPDDADAEESEENTEDTGDTEAEENTPAKPAAITPFAAEDLGNIFTFESFQKDEQDIEDGAEIEFNTQYQLQYAWETEDVDVKAGDTATLPLPDIFEHWTNLPDQEIVADGIIVGTYNINNGELTFVFNENIEGAAVQNGFVGLNLEFNEEKFLEEWEHEIDFDGDGEKDLTVIVIPGEVETSLDKEGHPDSDLNAREITWEVDFTNGSDEDIENGILTDTLPEGLGEARDFVVKELSFDFDGNKSVGEEVAFNDPTVNGNEFELSFDNVPARGGYRVEYTTTITDYTISEFTNDATFAYDNETLPADTTVYSGERSNPIQKEGKYNWDTGQIDWTIIVNENGMDIANAIVHDELPEEQTLAEGSISVSLNGQTVEVEENDFPITLGEVSPDDVYVINFSTDIDWSKVNGGEYQHHNEFFNETELRDGENPIGEDDAKVDHWRSSLIEKSGNANDYNYEDKVLSWTIDVNKAKHPIDDAVLTDILPVGLETMTFEDITIEGAQVDSEDVTITRNDDGTQTVVINLGNIDDEVTVSYQTEVEDFEKSDFNNEASLGGDGIGVETPKDDATANPPGNSFTKDFKGIDYSEKTIDWEISVDPEREAITELKIEDTFPNNGMILLPETVSVKIGGTELEEGTDYTLEPNTDGGETGYNKGFTINLINISEDSPLNEVLTVDFKTSYDPQLEVDENTADDHTGDPTLYTNHANFTGKTVNGNDFDRNDDAETRVREDSWNSGKKEGQLVDFDEDGTDRKIAWQVYTNYQKQNLGKDVSVTDTLDYEGIIDEDSIVVSVYEVDEDGNTTITDQTINDYSVEVTGKEFTLTFDEEFEVDERYVIEFTTSVPDISEESYTNNAMLKVGESEYPYTATVNYDRWDDFLDKQALGQTENDVFIGEELEWEVTVNESLSIIKDATIKDTISAGLTYVEGSLEITTQSGAELVEGTDYTLGSSETDEGETVLDIVFKEDVTEALTLNYTTVVTAEDGQSVNNKIELDGVGIEDKSKETSSLTAKQFSWVGGEYNPNRGALQVKKVDSASGEVIDADEATFELYYELNGERIQFGEEFTTVNGILDVGNLPLRTYYLTEVEAPDGYILSEEEIEIVVDKTFNNNDENIIEVPFENVKKVDITVEKIWNDEEDQAGFRPDTITVYLHSGENEDPIDSTELNIENSWETSFTDLPEVDEDGNKIVYTIEEVKVPNYESEVVTDEDNPNHFIVTNTHEPELINLEGTKTWNDADNQDGVRPVSITVNLLANGTKVDDTEVTEATDWTFEFTDLPKFENGEKINYTIQEIDVEDYSTEITGMDITNSYTPDQTSINVVKAWEDANNQDGIRSESITVKLLADGVETDKEVELNEDNNWQADFTDLDVYADGEEIVYTIEEVEVAGYVTEDIAGNAADGFVVTNTHEPELIDIDGTKTWEDADNQDGVRPVSITVNLLANGTKVDDIEVTEETDWTFEFTGLPKFENGEEINYTIQEVDVEDYSTEITGMDITNSYTPGQTSINVVKDWKDADNQDGIRPESITVKLLADGEETGQEVQLNEGNNWQADFTDLDVYADGEEIDYTIEEVAVEGYITEDIAGNAADGFVITNSYTPELINLEGTKTWDDADNQDGVRPVSITVNLLANGTKVDDIEVTEETDWTFEFTGLPKFENGEEINYTIQEVDVEDYSTEITGMDITNSYTPDQTSINVVKAWDDANNQDGIRSNSITVKLLANSEETGKEVQLSEENNWQADFTDLDVYIDGEKIVYTIEEVEVASYETTIIGTSEDGFVIKNSYDPELINVDGTKTWDDAENQDGKRPDSITVNLLADGTKVADVEVTEETDWTFEFTDLPKFESGEEINYTVQEDNVEDYSTEIIGMDITNSYTPEQTSVNVVKRWEDVNNQDGIRSDSITVKLLANGEETGKEVQLNEDNNWQAGFTGLDAYVDGEEIVYTVEEVEVAGYETSMTGTSEDGFIITNKHEPELINLAGTKTWDDANNQDGKRPDSITVNLLANGEKVDSVEVTDTTFEFIDLPKYENGEEITYTIQEDGVEDYSTEIDGMDITNSYTPGQTSVNVIKNWNDENYKDLRPDSITVKLLADGEETDQEVQLDADNNWQADFTDLDEYVDGEKVVYTIEEVEVTGYVTEDIAGNAADGFVITNSPAKVSVGDYVWFDENKDGLQDDTDVPIEGVVLTVEDENGDPVTDVYGNPVGPTATDEKGWYTFDDLPIDHTYTVRIDQEASAEVLKEYVPTLHEMGDDRAIDSSTWEATSRHLTEDGERDPTLDFGFVKKVIEVSGEKTWEDADNQDGNRPDTITVNLLANGKEVDSTDVTAEDNWEYIFTDLLKYEAGEEIVYTVTENTVEGYTQEIDGHGITNHYTPGETAVTVTKHWDDANNQDGKRLDSIEVQLTADGEVHGDPVELSDQNNWTYTWKELDEKAAGKSIVYSVVEITEVPEYETSINDKDHGNIIITNAYTPEEIEITGTKTWDDADNEAGTRPDSITVNLLANGSIVDSIEVTEADDWNYSFTGLAKYESGEEIEYSVAEVEVDGYETSINGFDITNTLIPVEEDPKEPEEPELGGDGGEKDPEDPTDLDGAGEEGELPKTATNIYNLALIGFGLMLLGLILFLVRRKRIE